MVHINHCGVNKQTQHTMIFFPPSSFLGFGNWFNHLHNRNVKCYVTKYFPCVGRICWTSLLHFGIKMMVHIAIMTLKKRVINWRQGNTFYELGKSNRKYLGFSVTILFFFRYGVFGWRGRISNLFPMSWTNGVRCFLGWVGGTLFIHCCFTNVLPSLRVILILYYSVYRSTRDFYIQVLSESG